MLVRLHFVQNKLNTLNVIYLHTAQPDLTKLLCRVAWCRWCELDLTVNVFRLPPTVADSVYTDRRDATRQFCCVELSGVNCVLRRVHSGRTGLNRTAIQFSAVLPL